MDNGAQWIWIDHKRHGHPEYVLFRKSVALQQVPRSLSLSITADSRYILSINNRVVSRGPARSGAATRYYDTVDIAGCLRPGDNVVAVDVIHYISDQHDAHEFITGPTSVSSSTRGGLLIFGDERFQTDGSYRCRRLDAYQFRQAAIAEYIGYMEEVDGGRVPHGWRLSGYDDGDWSAAEELIDNVPFTRGGLANVWQIEPRPIPLPFETPRDFAAITRCSEKDLNLEGLRSSGLCVPAGRTAYVELDAGVYRTGFVDLDILGGAGSRVSVLYSESYGYDENGEYYIKKGRDDWRREGSYLRGDCDVYLAGGGEQTYTSFHYRAFRFIRLEVQTGGEPIAVRVRGYRETGYPLDVTTRFTSRDDTYNQMWDVSVHTLQCCMYETYMDCPHYEQMQYLMDTFLEANYTYSISRDSRLAEKAIRDFYECQLPNGLIPCNAPSRIVQIIPLFTLYFIFMVHDHYWHFKQLEMVEDNFIAIENIVLFFKRHIGAMGLVSHTGFWQFIDWAKEWDNGVPVRDGDEDILLISMIFVAALQAAAELAEALGRTDRETEFRSMAQTVSDAVNLHGYDKQEGLYRDVIGRKAFSQHGQMWAVLSGIAQGGRAKEIMRKAVSRPDLVACSLCTRYFLFRALEKVGLYEETQAQWRIWKDLLDMHVTTWPEDPVNWRSDCHAWSATPLHEFVTCGLGIRPDTPGYEVVRVAPKMLWLGRCEGSVRTPYGDVTVAWWEQEERFTLLVQTQAETPLVVELPDGTSIRETLDGQRQWTCLLGQPDMAAPLAERAYVV